MKQLLNHAKKLIRHEQADAAVEYAVLLSMIVSAVFLGAEMLQRTSTALFRDVAHAAGGQVGKSGLGDAKLVNLAESMEEAEDSWVTIAQLAAAFGFVFVATGFVVRSHFRRRTEKLDDSVHSGTLNESEKENLLYVKRQELFRTLAGGDFVEALNSFNVARLMTTHVTTVNPKTSAMQVRKLMTEKHIHHVLVCGKDGTVLGVVSDRDLLAKDGYTAQDVMTADPVCVAPETAVLPTVTIMLERRISCLPVVFGEKVVGMLTTTDILLALQSLLQVLHIKLAANTETASV